MGGQLGILKEEGHIGCGIGVKIYIWNDFIMNNLCKPVS